MAFNFDIELSTAIACYEERFGDRDKRFRLLPVEFHDLPYAQSLVSERDLTVAVKLDIAAKNDDRRLKYQIWHEGVHCLAPVESMKTLWFEEGLAVQNSMYSPPVNRQFRRACTAALKRELTWYNPWVAFQKLKAEDEQIREIHNRAPERKFDLITPDLIVEIFGASQELADTLCGRLPERR